MSTKDRRFTETGLPWHIVEEAMNREIEWLESHCFTACMDRESANPIPPPVLFGHESSHGITRYVDASDKYAEETHHKYYPLARRR